MQLMPLPLAVSCFSKIQIGSTFLVPAHPGSPRKGPLNGCVCGLCVCVCVCVCACVHATWQNKISLEIFVIVLIVAEKIVQTVI